MLTFLPRGAVMLVIVKRDIIFGIHLTLKLFSVSIERY